MVWFVGYVACAGGGGRGEWACSVGRAAVAENSRRRTGSGASAGRRVAATAATLGVSARARWAVIVAVGELDGVIRLGGWGGRELLGWSASELRSAPYWEWLHPDDRDLVAEAAELLLRSGGWGRFWPVELRFLARDRRYWWTRWHLTATAERPVVCAEGVALVGDAGSQGPPVGTWGWNIDADTVVWSPELLDMFGFRVGPPASYQAFLASVDVEDRADVDRLVQACVVSGEPYITEFRAAHRDRGRERWFHAAGRVEPTTDSRHRHLLGVVKDLNPRPG